MTRDERIEAIRQLLRQDDLTNDTLRAIAEQLLRCLDEMKKERA